MRVLCCVCVRVCACLFCACVVRVLCCVVRVHLQHRLLEDKAHVADMLLKQGGRIYVCGDGFVSAPNQRDGLQVEWTGIYVVSSMRLVCRHDRPMCCFILCCPTKEMACRWSGQGGCTICLVSVLGVPEVLPGILPEALVKLVTSVAAIIPPRSPGFAKCPPGKFYTAADLQM